MHRTTKRILSCILAVTLVLAAIPFSVSAIHATRKTKEMNFAAMSDIHYFPAELTGNYRD